MLVGELMVICDPGLTGTNLHISPTDEGKNFEGKK